MSFRYEYTVQFRDTDAAGVVYFANIISICHIAYEASLIQSGIDLKLFVTNPDFAVPITHVSADFLRPLYCGDRVTIELTPHSIGSCKFEIKYLILASIDGVSTVENLQGSSHLVEFATATTKHVVIDPAMRKRQELPEILKQWLVEWS
jgi:1,4-dihydroxy-2-naphthoyl-CoA hydrolase